MTRAVQELSLVHSEPLPGVLVRDGTGRVTQRPP